MAFFTADFIKKNPTTLCAIKRVGTQTSVSPAGAGAPAALGSGPGEDESRGQGAAPHGSAV